MLSARLRALRVFSVSAVVPHADRHRVSHRRYRVLPTDIDLNLHLTNSRYFQLMDIGRLDLLMLAGALARVREGYGFVAAEVSCSFRRELPLWQAFSVRSEMVARDRKALKVEQRFLVGDREHALGHVTMLLLRHGKVVEPEPLLGLLPAG